MFFIAPSNVVLAAPIIVNVPDPVPTLPFPVREPICWPTPFRLKMLGLVTVKGVLVGSVLGMVQIRSSPSVMIVPPLQVLLPKVPAKAKPPAPDLVNEPVPPMIVA